MNVTLENLHDVRRPRWSHFGARKTAQIAAKVKELLESERYKLRESDRLPDDAIGPESIIGPKPSAKQATKKANAKSLGPIHEGMTAEEQRFLQLELDVGKEHAEQYFADAVAEQPKESKEARKERSLKSSVEVQEAPLEAPTEAPKPAKASQAPKAPKPPKVKAQRTESQQPKPTKVKNEPSEAELLRNMELQRALEAKAAAEARAEEERKRTAEFQSSLLAQFAEMQKELLRLRARDEERSREEERRKSETEAGERRIVNKTRVVA